MPEYEKLRLKQYAQIQDRETSESKYWKCFVHTAKEEEKLHGTPNSIHFNPVDAGMYIVTASAKINLYNAFDKLQRGYSRFQDDAFSGRFRKDGKLIVAGDKSGYLKVFDVQTKSVLRQLKKHSAAVRSTVWSCDGLHMISGSDDRSVLRWDLATQEVVWDNKFGSAHRGHTDYVRRVSSHPTSSELFISGGMDHMVHVWDHRQPAPVHSFTHDQPIEDCMVSPSGTLLFSAHGNSIKIWDLLVGNGRSLHEFSNHQKNISSIAMDSSSNRLLSSGLDGHVKIYSMQSMEVTYGYHYDKPIVSMDINNDNTKVVFGFVDGTVVRRNRSLAATQGSLLGVETVSSSSSSNPAEHHRKILAKHKSGTDVESGIVEVDRMTRLAPYDTQLKKFQYQQALDSALHTRNPLVVMTVLEELSHRSGLTIALSGRDETTLESLLAFIARYVAHPRYARLLVQVAHRLLDLYASVLGHSDAIDELFLKLQKQVNQEKSFRREIMKIMGSLDSIINMSSIQQQRQAMTEDSIQPHAGTEASS